MSEFINPSIHSPETELIARSEYLKFVANPMLHELFSAFGFEPAEGDVIYQMQEFAANNWDFRGGKSRQQTEWGDLEEGALRDQVFESATEFGMVESSMPSSKGKTVDVLTILGGANKAPLQRLEYALSFRGEYIKSLGQIVLLGSHRPVIDKIEIENTSSYAPSAQIEFDLLNGAVESVFGYGRSHYREDEFDLRQELDLDQELQPALIRTYTAVGEVAVVSLLVPAVNGQQNANTEDGFLFLRSVFRDDIDEKSRILSSTNAIYKPFQHLEVVSGLTLPTGATVETIGFSAEYAGIVRKAPQLLQEIKSAIDSAIKLKSRLPDRSQE